MKSNTKLWSVTGLGAALALGTLLLQGSGGIARAQSEPRALARQGEDAHSALEGTWRVTVMLNRCDTGAPIGGPFHSLLTFAPGGTMTGTTSNPAFQPGQRSPDYGVWKRTGWDTYSALSEALVTFSGGPFVAGSQILTHQITITDGGTGFTDAAGVQFFDTAGAPQTPPPACAVATGQRLQ